MSEGDVVILLGMLVVIVFLAMLFISPWLDRNFRKCSKCGSRMKYLGTKVAYATMIPLGGVNHFFKCPKCGEEDHYYESEH